jgi:transglutaminase-like putative cysteine protease
MQNPHKRFGGFALAAAIAVSVVACEAGYSGGGTNPNEAAPASAGTQGSPEPSWLSGFLSPVTDEQAVRSLFEVEAENREYWRILTLDGYDGERWTSTNMGGSEGGLPLTVPAILPRSAGRPPARAETMNQTFRILSDFDSAGALPMAQTAEEIAGPIGDITWDPVRSQAFIDGDLEAGMTYTVRSRIVVPTPEELDRVPHLAPWTYGRWTELPADLDPRIGQIAERWTAHATSNYRKVLAIQEHFHNGAFVYDTAVGIAVDDDALVEFLTQTKAGFCQQLSSAMAVMVRTLGLPARIGVGYRSETRQDHGTYLVQAGDTHVWVEVLFPGYGWIQFEPEPGSTHPNAQAGTYLNP